jgi:hypothetical protein
MKMVNQLTQTNKSQITMFVIVGIVILVIFIFLFYLLSSITETKTKPALSKTKISSLTAPVLQFYIADCLKDVFKEGLIEIGLQGGYFYENESGYSYPPNYNIPKTYLDNNISYLIYPQDINPITKQGFYNPGWPCISSAYGGDDPSYCRFINLGSEIEYIKSDNKIMSSVYSPRFGRPRNPQIRKIQEQLEQYIIDELPGCVDFAAVEDHFPGYTITPEEPIPEVAFGVVSTSVHLNYPIKMEFQDFEPVIIVQEFQSVLPVRFEKLYKIVNQILKGTPRNELNDINFDPDIEKERIFNELAVQGVILTIREKGYDDIFIINDSLSQMDGKSYIFQFARRNRPPVLNYISKSPSYLYNIENSSKDIYDYLVVPGLYPLNITPNATDPDEDIINYYSERGIQSLRQSDFSNVLNLFYDFNESETGYHNITITASDFELEDKQKVRILADNLLKAEGNVYNLHGIDVYSAEDPYFLNASAAMKTLDPFATYYFRYIILIIICQELEL